LSNVLVPSHLIEVEDSLRLVRFDPFSESWRTPSGSAFRYSDRTGRFEPFDHAQACAALAPQIEAATAEFGIPASYPWVVPELDQAQRLPLPRDIHSIWLGRRMPRPLVENVLRNAREAGKGRLPFTYHLYVDVADPLDHSLMMADLAQAPVNLRVHELRRTPFFEAFAQSPYHLQFKAATEGTGINYASAVDVLRYRLLHFHGGVYMDVDDFIYASPLENEGFSSQDWTVAPERLLLNNLVSEPRLGLVCGFNTSNFATLPANPLLEAVSKESYSRFLTNRDLYFQRPYEGIDSPEQVTAYARRINQVTGPGVFNDVLLERLPDVRQFRALCRIANELYVPAREFGPLHREIRRHAQRYCPLGWRIRIGATSSWLHTR
jgi:Glycosyltransferase sugar-binding region containing DXD motif